MSKYEKISVNVDKRLIEKLDNISDFTFLNRSALVVTALAEFVERFERKMEKLNNIKKGE